MLKACRLYSNTSPFRWLLSPSPMATKRSLNQPSFSTLAKKKKIPVIGTHNGSFHCDEALACFLLRRTGKFSDAEVVRTRDYQVSSPGTLTFFIYLSCLVPWKTNAPRKRIRSVFGSLIVFSWRFSGTWVFGRRGWRRRCVRSESRPIRSSPERIQWSSWPWIHHQAQ